MEKINVTYNYVSPDNFTIRYDNFDSKEEAHEYYLQWLKGFEKQGYYSTVRNGQRYQMPLDELKEICYLKEFEIENEEDDLLIKIGAF